jgi:hypothetical protein
MTTDLDVELVHELSPTEPGPSNPARDRARAALAARIESERAAARRAPARRSWLPVRPVSLGLAGAAALAAVTLLAVGALREGVARPGSAAALLFDPRTPELLGGRTTVVKPPSTFHVKPGTVVYESTYISSGIAEQVGQRPAP